MSQKTKQRRVFYDLVEQLESAIINEMIKPGDKLPAERELGEIFQTSRGTIREALRVLEQKGLIEIKIGSSGGALVKPANTDGVKEHLSLLMKRQKVSLNHLAEFREGVEGTVMTLAVKRMTPEALQELHTLLADLKTCVEHGVSHWKELIRLDKAFHLTLAKIAGNPLFFFVLQVVYDNLSDYYERYPFGTKHAMEDNYQDACEMVRLIENNQEEEAVQLLQKHIRKFNRYMNIRKDDAPKEIDLTW